MRLAAADGARRYHPYAGSAGALHGFGQRRRFADASVANHHADAVA